MTGTLKPCTDIDLESISRNLIKTRELVEQVQDMLDRLTMLQKEIYDSI